MKKLILMTSALVALASNAATAAVYIQPTLVQPAPAPVVVEREPVYTTSYYDYHRHYYRHHDYDWHYWHDHGRHEGWDRDRDHWDRDRDHDHWDRDHDHH